MKLTPDDRIEYARAVWATFQGKAKTKRDMSNSEFWVVSKWMDRGLPLPVVLRGIVDFGARPRRLEAVVGSVDESISRWHYAMGGLTELPEAGHLEGVP